jgi:hypothetical protein
MKYLDKPIARCVPASDFRNLLKVRKIQIQHIAAVSTGHQDCENQDVCTCPLKHDCRGFLPLSGRYKLWTVFGYCRNSSSNVCVNEIFMAYQEG